MPGHTHIPLTLEAVATQGPHYWLPGGKLVAQNQHKKTTRLVLDSDFWVDL